MGKIEEDKNIISEDIKNIDREIIKLREKIGELRFYIHQIETEKKIMDGDMSKLLAELSDLTEERMRKI